MAVTYEPIATTTLSSASNSITFSSISSAYTDLRLILCWIGPNGYGNYLRFNSDTASNYSRTILYGNGAAASSSRATSQTTLPIENLNGATATIPMLAQVDIFSYAGSTYKTALISVSSDTNGGSFVSNAVGLWQSTSAISTILFGTDAGQNFAIGTTATLYGIKSA